MSHNQSKTNPYRKVSVATWTDRKVMNLSPLQPSGQALFLMLMIGPQTTNIPGIQPVGRMAFAEMLGWELEAFDQAFEEALREGLAKADWKARLIFVPNAIKHNLPQSPNVVTSWGPMWARVPDCPLKTEAWNVLHEALCALGDVFANAFKSACPLMIHGFAEDVTDDDGKPSDKASGKPIDKATHNQEAVSSKQGLIPPIPPKGGIKDHSKPDGETSGEDMQRFEEFWDAYPRKTGKSDALKAFKALKVNAALMLAIMVGLAKWTKHPRWTKNGGEFIKHPGPWLRGRLWEDEEVCGNPGPAAQQAVTVPHWVQAAGFSCIEEAENFRCNAVNFVNFEDGKRIRPDERRDANGELIIEAVHG